MARVEFLMYRVAVWYGFGFTHSGCAAQSACLRLRIGLHYEISALTFLTGFLWGLFDAIFSWCCSAEFVYKTITFLVRFGLDKYLTFCINNLPGLALYTIQIPGPDLIPTPDPQGVRPIPE